MVLAFLLVVLYFGIRGILQVWIPRGSITIKKYRVVLGIVSFPVISMYYLGEIIEYMTYWTPGTWAIQPMPVEYFFAWVIFVVADTLYQYSVIQRIAESNV